MLIVGNNNGKDWEEIKKLLRDLGVDYLDTENPEEDIDELEDLGYIIAKKATERKNDEQRKNIAAVLGVIINNQGVSAETMLISIKRYYEEYYEGECTIGILLEEQVMDVFTKKIHTNKWFKDFMDAHSRSYKEKFTEYESLEDFTVEIPKKVAEHSWI